MSNALESLIVIDRLEIGPVTVEPRRLIAPYPVVVGNEEDATELGHGCCSHGAHFADKADRKRVQAAISKLDDSHWQFRELAGDLGGAIEKDEVKKGKEDMNKDEEEQGQYPMSREQHQVGTQNTGDGS